MTANEPQTGWVDGWARRHYKQAIVIRTLLAPWILFVVVFLCAQGDWSGLVFLPFFALDLWLLRNLVRYGRSRNADSGR